MNKELRAKGKELAEKMSGKVDASVAKTIAGLAWGAPILMAAMDPMAAERAPELAANLSQGLDTELTLEQYETAMWMFQALGRDGRINMSYDADEYRQIAQQAMREAGII